MHHKKLTKKFKVKKCVRQGCRLSPVLFLVAIDYVMKETTVKTKIGIQSTLIDQLEDLDFAADLTLLSHSNQHMQDKITRLWTTSCQISLHLNPKKTQIIKMNTEITDPVTFNENTIEEVESLSWKHD